MWAPAAAGVNVVIGEDRNAMTREAGGWWSAAIEGAGAGTDYLFSVDGGEPRPDPRSAHQPYGVDGPSRVVDHSAYEWSDTAWRGLPHSAAVIYELHVGTFTPEGTFDAATARLDHLSSLGVSAVELCPVNEFSGERGWGYDGVDLFAPHHGYGDPDSLKRFVDACHASGMAVILDVVYNHLGPAGNYLDTFGPYFTSRYSTPWGPAVNFDGPDSYEVRRFVADNVLLWLRDYRFDGLRIDAVHAILDMSAVNILEQVAAEVSELEATSGRTKFLIAESDLNDPRVVTERDANGYGIDAQWSDDFHHSLHALATGDQAGYYADFGSVGDLAKALTSAFVYDWRYSPFRARMHGRAPRGLPGHRFLAYMQDHDQVGNRARGERSSELMSPGLLKVAAALVIMSPFVPMLFMGEEWGARTPFQYFTSHPGEALGRAVSEGRRAEFAAFGWDTADVPDPQDPETFARSKLDWAELNHDSHCRILEWHRSLIELRRSEPDLNDFDLAGVSVAHSDEDRWLVLRRGSIVVACNFSQDPQMVPGPGSVEVLLASDEGGEQAAMAGESVLIYRTGP